MSPRSCAISLLWLLFLGPLEGESWAAENASVDASKPTSAAAAQAHFDKGLQAYEARDIATACFHFGKSYRLDPLPGVLFTLATCEVRSGKIATGAKRYREFLALVESLAEPEQAKQEARAESARSELQTLEGQIPKLTITSQQGDDARIRLNGKELTPTQIGQLLLLDPGDYTLTLETAEGVVEERQLKLAKGQEVEVELGKTKKIQAPQGAVEELPAASPDRTSFYIAAGIGATGLALGSVTGLIALSASSCDGRLCSDEDALQKAENARSIAHVSTASFIVGAVASSTAAVLWFQPFSKETKTEAVKLRVGVAARGAYLEGSF